jgi:hypothetical protein
MELAKIDVRPPADLKARVMERISSEGSPSLIRHLSDILLRPYRVMLTPAHGLGLAVALAAVVAIWPIGAPSTPTEPAPGGVATHFVFVDPRVSSVQLTGDFTAWSREGIPLRDVNGSGVWVAEVALPPGVYQYVFIVDGQELRADPQAAAQVDDGFGQTNSIVMVSSEW